MVRIDLDDLAVVCDGAIMILVVVGEHTGAHIVGFDVVRLQLDGFTVVGDDAFAQSGILANIVDGPIEVPTGPPGASKVGLQGYGGVEVREALFAVFLP